MRRRYTVSKLGILMHTMPNGSSILLHPGQLVPEDMFPDDVLARHEKKGTMVRVGGEELPLNQTILLPGVDGLTPVTQEVQAPDRPFNGGFTSMGAVDPQSAAADAKALQDARAAAGQAPLGVKRPWVIPQEVLVKMSLPQMIQAAREIDPRAPEFRTMHEGAAFLSQDLPEGQRVPPPAPTPASEAHQLGD